jgi:phage RecT family recombinase
MADIKTLVDLAGSQERYNAYAKAVKTALPKTQRDDAARYWSIYSQMMQEFLQNDHITNKQSILSCMFNAPKLGLNPDKVFGHIWFVPYKGVLTYQVGYRGMIQLSLNTGKVRNVRAGLVREKDKWEYFEDEQGQHYRIEPQFMEKDRGREIFGYSIFTDTQGNPNIHVMESAHIDDVKKIVKARMGENFAYCPWGNPVFEPEMRKKTVIRRHWKTEPMSAEIASVLETEEKTERGEVPTKEENDKAIDYILQNFAVEPDSQSEEGKKLNAELDRLAAK